MCQTCGEWIGLGRDESEDAALANHEGWKRCLANVKRENHRRSTQQAADALEEIRRNAQSESPTDTNSSPFPSIGQPSLSL
jgi:hypothetical protein